MIEKIEEMIRRYRVHNINFVTPDHFIPHIVLIISRIKKKYDIPVIFNTSGYQSVEILRKIKDYVDIYLPDFKYSERSLAKKLSLCPDYTEVCLDAIYEMVKQKGFLKTEDGIAKRGVLVRHLILPGKIKNSIDVLSLLYCEFGKELPISLMSQYFPAVPQKDPDLNRFLKKEEFLEVYNHAISLGFENIFIQIPERPDRSFVPDFTKEQPFPGNKQRI